MGLSKKEIELAEPLPSAKLDVRALDEICRSKPWLEGLAATTSLEGINDPLLRKQAGVIILNDMRAWEHLKLASRALRLRTIHLEGDEGHMRDGLNGLSRHANTVKTSNAVLKVAKLAVFAFRTLMEGIGQAALNPGRSSDERE